MLDWLAERFETETDYDENGNPVTKICWEDENGMVSSVDANLVVQLFGAGSQTKAAMLSQAPTDGWKRIIERWDELGKFE